MKICACAVTSDLNFLVTNQSYGMHFSVYVCGIYLQFDRNNTGCGTARKGVGTEDTIFIEFINILLVQKSFTVSALWQCALYQMKAGSFPSRQIPNTLI